MHVEIIRHALVNIESYLIFLWDNTWWNKKRAMRKAGMISMGWKNLVETARDASETMEPGDKKFAFWMVFGISGAACCVGGILWRMLS